MATRERGGMVEDRAPQHGAPTAPLTSKRRAILAFIVEQAREKGYPPSVREIGEAVGLASSSTVHAHLATLESQGYLRRDPTKPRAIEVRYATAGPNQDHAMPRADSQGGYDNQPNENIRSINTRHVPLIGNVAAGTDVLADQNVEDILALPRTLTGSGELFALKVRGDSMIDAGIYDGDTIVVRSQNQAERGDIVVAGIPGEEATVKRLQFNAGTVTLVPENQYMEPMVFDASDVTIYGKVVSLLRRL